MLKCVTAEVIIGLYSYCIKMSPIKKGGIRQRSTIQDFAPFPPQSVPSSHPFFLSLSSPFLLRPYFLLEETSLLSSHFLLNFIFPVYFYFLLYSYHSTFVYSLFIIILPNLVYLSQT